MRFSALILICFSLGVSCKREAPQPHPSILHEAFADRFLIGFAINNQQVRGNEADAIAIVKKHANSITAENDMKWQNVQPAVDFFNFTAVDAFVAFGEEHKMKTIGHTLVWHSQLPNWVHNITDSAELVAVMEQFITSYAGRYAGKIHGWDVVNEAFNNDGSYRDTVFYKYIGPRFIERAFELAHEVDPNAELYYNDYNMTFPGKRNAVIAMVQNLQAKNIRIDGIGMQGHWTLTHPSLEEIEESIIAYASTGLQVMITELDISVLPRNENPYRNGLPESVSNQLAQRYADLFRLFIKHSDKISRVTFWGVHDGQSWLNDHPTLGRTNYPLLFDRNYNPKQCLYSILEVSQYK